MYQTNILIAGLTVKVTHQYEHFKKFAADFTVSTEKADLDVYVTKDNIEKERMIVKKQREIDGHSFSYTDAILEQTAIYRKIAEHLTKYHAIVFHGSAVAIKEKAVLFTAPSGMGKTTHTKLWLKNIKNSYVVDGDKPILRVMNHGIYVCGTPWKGKERMGCNKNVPLKAICSINRSPENRIEKVNLSAFLPVLLKQSYHPKKNGSSGVLVGKKSSIPQ